MKTAAFLIGAAGFGFLAGGATTMASRGAADQPRAVQAAAMATPGRLDRHKLAHCSAIDGDTLRCGGERIRLLGIDTPEMPGHCAEGRRCVSGDPHAAQAALSGSVSGSMTIRRFGTDRYGRTLALVQGPLGDLSCSQLRAGHAIYRPDWDVGGAMKKACGGRL